MEYFKHFITEEIYILPPAADDASSEKSSTEREAAEPQTVKYPVAVICSKLAEDEKKLLSGILNAVKLDLEEVEIIDSYKNISADMILSFGNYPELTSLSRYQPVKKDGKTILIADKLSEIQRDVSKKQMLWNALQQMFNI